MKNSNMHQMKLALAREKRKNEPMEPPYKGELRLCPECRWNLPTFSFRNRSSSKCGCCAASSNISQWNLTRTVDWKRSHYKNGEIKE